MICEKTGAIFYLAEYGIYFRGDAYRLGGHLLIRVNNRSGKAHSDIVHYIVATTEFWFDRDSEHGTIVSKRFVYEGYEGQPT